ncbi:hypothetical protein AAGG74_14625 [Bacillus mexicanus]|uniref:S8 family serine peptidase n=1 Tax=Bacillus mexicanus TaxID=2834415 RepID=UPI003D19AA10
MKKQIYFWIVLILIFILSLSYFLYKRYIPEKSNISSEQTKEALENLNNQYNTKELIVVFKDGVSEKEVKEVISDFDGEIIDKLPDIQNYHIKINKKMTTQEVLSLVENLNKKKEVSLAVLNEKADSDENKSYFNNTDIENNKVFDEALSIYNKPANVFYSQDGTHSYLYPSKWNIEKDGEITFQNEDKNLKYKLKKSPLDLYEDVTNKLIQTEETQGFTLDGEMDEYQRNDLTVVKWIMKKEDTLQPRAIIQGKDYYYYFETNNNVSLDEFSLIVDSFIVNKNPLNKK